MAHRAGGRTCRAPRPGPRLVSRDLSASASSCSFSQGRGPQGPAGADGRGPRSLRCQPCPVAKRRARLATLSAARDSLGGSRRPSRAGRGSAAPSSLGQPVGLYKLGLRPPGVPAPAPPRLPGAPRHPLCGSTRPAPGTGPHGTGWPVGAGDPRSAHFPRRSPTLSSLGGAFRSRVGAGGDSFLPGRRSQERSVKVPQPRASRTAPHSQVRPAWQEQPKPCSPGPQRPLGPWSGSEASTGASACHQHHHGPCRRKEMRTSLGSTGQGLNPGCTGHFTWPPQFGLLHLVLGWEWRKKEPPSVQGRAHGGGRTQGPRTPEEAGAA